MDIATVIKCTKSLIGADKFLKSSISDTINKITIEVRKIDHCLSKKSCETKTPNREKMNKGTRTMPAPFGTKILWLLLSEG